jgi:outer membrane protein assembly factor BamB
MGTVYYKGEADYQPGTAFTGGGGRAVNGDEAWGAIRALEATTGKMKWEFRLLSPGWTSLLSTAGGLVFGGTEEGNFFALDAESGKPLWDIQLGGAVRGIPISYAVTEAIRRHFRRLRCLSLAIEINAERERENAGRLQLRRVVPLQAFGHLRALR